MPLLGGAPLMGLPGRGGPDARDRRVAEGSEAAGVQVRAGGPPRGGEAPAVSGGPSTGTAAQLREITELLGKLGQLRDNGVLSEQEFSDQKARLLADG
jgi:hypothetical protein